MKKKWLYSLTLSNSRLFRIERHFLFWVLVFLYHFIRIGIFYPDDKLWGNLYSITRMAFIWGVCFNIYFTYLFVYYLLPKFYNRKKYLALTIAFILLAISLQFLGFLYNHFNVNGAVSPLIGMDYKNDTFLKLMRPTVIRLLGNPPLICGFFLALKTIKGWYKEQLQNELLAKEKANAELQLLKAQVHPHFLFNTLNNIYSFTLHQLPQAEGLVEKLSDMLRYMITDCNSNLVSLEKEFKMLEDYIGLEKVRYGDRLELWVDINGGGSDLLIAPLIMIPFVENCFKHGTSVMRGKQWIQLKIAVHNNVLDFNLTNSKPPKPMENKNKNGIGLTNVQKRLTLIYPGKHELTISSNESVFNVHLTMELQQQFKTKQPLEITTINTIAYSPTS